MTLENWRLSFDPKLTLAAAAERLGIQGSNPARTYQRYETGENAVDVMLAVQIVRRTDGAVSLEDMATTREAWIASRRTTPKPTTETGRAA